MPTLKMKMTDEDIVRRFHAVLGFGKVIGPYRRKDNPRYKPYWEFSVGRFEHVQAIGAMFWPWLGIRRREQFRTAMLYSAKHSRDPSKSIAFQMFGRRLRDLSPDQLAQYRRAVTRRNRMRYRTSTRPYEPRPHMRKPAPDLVPIYGVQRLPNSPPPLSA